MQQQLHESNPKYGISSEIYAPIVAQIVGMLRVSELLDYGAGKGRLKPALENILKRPLTVHHYEPSRQEWAAPPAPCKFVACIDVLEHIEPELIDNVLDDLARVVSVFGMFTVHTKPALKVLPDGRNAHLIQQPAIWWLQKFDERFDLVTYNRLDSGGFWVGVERKTEGESMQRKAP